MVEDTVIKEPLTADMVAAGEELTCKLEEMGVALTAAIWFYDSEVNEWFLKYLSPETELHGSRELYGKIREARQQIPHNFAIPLTGVRMLRPNDNLVRALREGMKQAGLKNIPYRFKKSAYSGHYMDDVLVYRVA